MRPSAKTTDSVFPCSRFFFFSFFLFLWSSQKWWGKCFFPIHCSIFSLPENDSLVNMKEIVAEGKLWRVNRTFWRTLQLCGIFPCVPMFPYKIKPIMIQCHFSIYPWIIHWKYLKTRPHKQSKFHINFLDESCLGNNPSRQPFYKLLFTTTFYKLLLWIIFFLKCSKLSFQTTMDNFLATCRSGSFFCPFCKLLFLTNFLKILQITVKVLFLVHLVNCHSG